MTGKMIGVGLGPGDSELITVKSARLIENAEVIAYPALPATESFAREIAKPYLPDNIHEIVIEIPMRTARAPAQAAYDQGAARIAAILDTGRDVIVLCEGDPFFYGSFMYLFARLAGRYDVEVVPGVTSVSAAAARAGRPLTARNDSLTTIPAPLDDGTIRERIMQAESIAILKVGPHLGRIRSLLEELALTQSAVYVAHASLAEEVILPLTEAPDPAPYFSMILVTKGADPWLKPPS